MKKSTCSNTHKDEEEKKEDVDVPTVGAHPSSLALLAYLAPPPNSEEHITDAAAARHAEIADLKATIAVKNASRDVAFDVHKLLNAEWLDLQLQLKDTHLAMTTALYACRQARADWSETCDIYFLRQIKAREHPSNEARKKADDAYNEQKMALETVMKTHRLFVEATEKENVTRAAYDKKRLEYWAATASLDKITHESVLASVDLHLLEYPDSLEQDNHATGQM